MVQDRGPATSAITIVFVALATVFVAARFFTRISLVKSIKRDDWWILAAWIVAVGFSASICVGVQYGLGKHKADIVETSFATLRKAEYAFSVLYNPSLMLTKTSILVFYLSVMSKDADPVFKWCNWLTLAVVNIAGLALTLYTIFQCTPVAAGYQYPTPSTAQCTDIVTLYLSSAPVNIITDLAILFLPMPILTGMRLPRKQKMILVVTFSCGAFVAVVDVIRIAYLQNAAQSRLKVVNNGSGQGSRVVEENDFSWYASLGFMWSAVEVNLGIICACVPSLKPLFLRFLPRFVKDVSGEMSSIGSMDPGQPDVLSHTVGVEGSISMLSNPAAFRQPRTKEYSGEPDGDQMGFLDMLAGPGPDDDSATVTRATTGVSQAGTHQSLASDFGFVDMSGKRNMLKLSNRQSVWPLAVVTIIFFLWGFAYGLLDTLNSQFQRIVGLSTAQTLGLHAAYFGGYLVGPLTLGRFIIRRYGFKASMIAGLCVYGCGTLVFWPSAVLTSYPAFVISNVIVGFGLSCLEIAANPYTSLCGPLEWAEVRLNLSQGFQAVGTVCSSLLATKVLFRNVLDAPSLVDVQWTYLGIALFDFALAVVFYYIPLPEASDEELEELADCRSAAYRARVGPFKVVYVTLALAVFSQWCYVGAQESIGNNTQPLMQLLLPPSRLTPFDFQTVGHSVFAVGRFLTAWLNCWLKPRWILLALYAGCVVTYGLHLGLAGTAGAAIDMLTYLFESGIFSIIFAMAMRGMGSHTKTASALVTAAISGGAVFPFVQWAVSTTHGLRYSYCVPLAAAAFGMVFPLYLNLVPAARNQVDPNHEARTPRRAPGVLPPEILTKEPDSTMQPLGWLQKHTSDLPSAEHVEQHSQADRRPTSATILHDFPDFDQSRPMQLQAPRGMLGELKPWPTADDNSYSSGNEDSDVIQRHRTSEDEDDYHAALRTI